MKIERVSFAQKPETIAENVDCIWVRLRERSEPGPLASRALQWLDWQMQGKLSTLIKEGALEGKSPKGAIFLPTMQKLSVPLVAVEGAKTVDWEAFLQNCRGMKLKRVLYFCEEEDNVPDLVRELKEHGPGKGTEYPEIVAFGSDGN